jgi:hypothetical protein
MKECLAVILWHRILTEAYTFGLFDLFQYLKI